MTGLVAATIVAVGAGVSSAIPVHASNMGSQDCNGLWVDPAGNTYFGPESPPFDVFDDSNADFYGGAGGTTVTENGVSIYTNVFYYCNYNSSGPYKGNYTLKIGVWHDDVYQCYNGNCLGSADPFVSYDCGQMWQNNTWGNPELGCGNDSSHGGTQGTCPTSCIHESSSFLIIESDDQPGGIGFATEDRSGTAPTLVQPSGYAQETPALVQNWADQP